MLFRPFKPQWLLLCLILPLLPLWSAPLSAAHYAHHEPKTTVAIVLFPGVQIIDFSAPYEVFGQAGYEIYTATKDGRPVATAMGLSVNPDMALAELPAADLVLVPGGDINDAAADPGIRSWLQQRAKSTKRILSVCTGSHILASAGLLDGLTATTFHSAISQLDSDFPRIEVVRNARYVDNGQIITSAGLSSGIDAALHVVKSIDGEERARTIATHLEYDWDPENGYVRGLLADRFIPDINPQWPESTRINRVAHYGDRHQWLSRFEVQTELEQAAFHQLFGSFMAQLDNWQSIGDSRWVSQQQSNKITLSIDSDWSQSPRRVAMRLSAARADSAD
ncbi:MAG: hypothetical protein Tsb002_02410 [Wenzhouxiangellaceae bacterium]